MYFFILIGILLIYLLYKNKNEFEYENEFKYSIEQLEKLKTPILWIYVPQEYNARNWISFGSRSSYKINQPFLSLTTKSILNHCKNDFSILFFDDSSFSKLIPNWNICLQKISSPISDKIRMLGITKLLYLYGGMICPISFLCMKNLMELYEKGTMNKKPFVCEKMNKKNEVQTNMYFCGSPKHSKVMEQIHLFLQEIISRDLTMDSIFLGKLNTFCLEKIKFGEMNFIDGKEIGIKTMKNRPVYIEDLMSEKTISLIPNMYGIYIPADEILNRIQYGWFTRLSESEVLLSKTILGNYFLLEYGENMIEPFEEKKNWIGFWKVPSKAPVWGNKPNYLGDDLRMSSNPF